MQEIIDVLNENIIYILISLGIITFISTILIIVLFAKHKKLKNKYNDFMRGNNVDIESLLIESINKADNVLNEHKAITDSIEKLQKQLEKCIQNVGIVRYNALEGEGSDLSYAIALLDNRDNGIVINGIYTRSGSYSYAKPLINGESKYTLSSEEIEAIRRTSV